MPAKPIAALGSPRLTLRYGSVPCCSAGNMQPCWPKPQRLLAPLKAKLCAPKTCFGHS